MAAKRRRSKKRDDEWMFNDYFFDAEDSELSLASEKARSLVCQAVTQIQCYEDDSENSWVSVNHIQTYVAGVGRESCGHGLSTASNTLQEAGDSEEIVSDIAKETDSSPSSGDYDKRRETWNERHSSQKPQQPQKNEQKFRQKKSLSRASNEKSIKNNSESAQSNKRKRKENARKGTKKKRKRKEKSCGKENTFGCEETQNCPATNACPSGITTDCSSTEPFQNNQCCQVTTAPPETREECQQTCPIKQESVYQLQPECRQANPLKPGKYALSSRRPRCPRSRKRPTKKKERKSECRENSVVRKYNYDTDRQMWILVTTDRSDASGEETCFPPLRSQPDDNISVCECRTPEEQSPCQPTLQSLTQTSSPFYILKQSRREQGPCQSSSAPYWTDGQHGMPSHKLESVSSRCTIPMCDCSGVKDNPTRCLCTNKGQTSANVWNQPCACGTAEGASPYPIGLQLQCDCGSQASDDGCPEHLSLARQMAVTMVPQSMSDAGQAGNTPICSCSSTMTEEVAITKKDAGNSPCGCKEMHTQTVCDIGTCTNEATTQDKEISVYNTCEVGTCVSKECLQTPSVANKTIQAVTKSETCSLTFPDRASITSRGSNVSCRMSKPLPQIVAKKYFSSSSTCCANSQYRGNTSTKQTKLPVKTKEGSCKMRSKFGIPLILNKTLSSCNSTHSNRVAKFQGPLQRSMTFVSQGSIENASSCEGSLKKADEDFISQLGLCKLVDESESIEEKFIKCECLGESFDKIALKENVKELCECASEDNTKKVNSCRSGTRDISTNETNGCNIHPQITNQSDSLESIVCDKRCANFKTLVTDSEKLCQTQGKAIASPTAEQSTCDCISTNNDNLPNILEEKSSTEQTDSCNCSPEEDVEDPCDCNSEHLNGDSLECSVTDISSQECAHANVNIIKWDKNISPSDEASTLSITINSPSSCHKKGSVLCENGNLHKNSEKRCLTAKTNGEPANSYVSGYECKSKSLQTCQGKEIKGRVKCEPKSEIQSTSNSRNTNDICSPRRGSKRPWMPHSPNEIRTHLPQKPQIPKCSIPLPQSPVCSGTQLQVRKRSKPANDSPKHVIGNNQSEHQIPGGSSCSVFKSTSKESSTTKCTQNVSCSREDVSICGSSKTWIGHRISPCMAGRKDKTGIGARGSYSLRSSSDIFTTGSRGITSVKCGKYQIISGSGTKIPNNARRQEVNKYGSSISCSSAVEALITVATASSQSTSSFRQHSKRDLYERNSFMCKTCRINEVSICCSRARDRKAKQVKTNDACRDPIFPVAIAREKKASSAQSTEEISKTNASPQTPINACEALSENSINVRGKNIMYVCSCEDIDHSVREQRNGIYPGFSSSSYRESEEKQPERNTYPKCAAHSSLQINKHRSSSVSESPKPPMITCPGCDLPPSEEYNSSRTNTNTTHESNDTITTYDSQGPFHISNNTYDPTKDSGLQSTTNLHKYNDAPCSPTECNLVSEDETFVCTCNSSEEPQPQTIYSHGITKNIFASKNIRDAGKGGNISTCSNENIKASQNTCESPSNVPICVKECDNNTSSSSCAGFCPTKASGLQSTTNLHKYNDAPCSPTECNLMSEDETFVCTCNSSEEPQSQTIYSDEIAKDTFVSKNINDVGKGKNVSTCSNENIKANQNTCESPSNVPICVKVCDINTSSSSCAGKEMDICPCIVEESSSENICSAQVSPRSSYSTDDETDVCNWKQVIISPPTCNKPFTPMQIRKSNEKLQICRTDGNKLASARHIQPAQGTRLIMNPQGTPQSTVCCTNANQNFAVSRTPCEPYQKSHPHSVLRVGSAHKLPGYCSNSQPQAPPCTPTDPEARTNPTCAAVNTSSNPIIGQITGTMCDDGTILIDYNSLCAALSMQPEVQQWVTQQRNQERDTCRTTNTLPTIPETKPFSYMNVDESKPCRISHPQSPPCPQEPVRPSSSCSGCTCWLKVDVVPPASYGTSSCNMSQRMVTGICVAPMTQCSVPSNSTRIAQNCVSSVCNSVQQSRSCGIAQYPPTPYCSQTTRMPCGSMEHTQQCAATCQVQGPCTTVFQGPETTSYCSQTTRMPCGSMEHTQQPSAATCQVQGPCNTVFQGPETASYCSQSTRMPYGSMEHTQQPGAVTCQVQAPRSTLFQGPETTPCVTNPTSSTPRVVIQYGGSPTSFSIPIETVSCHVSPPTVAPCDASPCGVQPSPTPCAPSPACERAESCKCSLSCASQRPPEIRIIRDNASPGVASALDWSLGEPRRDESWETESTCNYKPFSLRRERTLPSGYSCPRNESSSTCLWDSFPGINAIQNARCANSATAVASAACERAVFGTPSLVTQRTLYRTTAPSQLQPCRTPYRPACHSEMCCSLPQCGHKTLYRPSPSVQCCEQPRFINRTLSDSCGMVDPGYIAVYREFKYPNNVENLQSSSCLPTGPRACRVTSPLRATDVCEARPRFRPPPPRSASQPFIIGHAGTSFNARISRPRKFSAGSERHSVISRRSDGSKSLHATRDLSDGSPRNHLSPGGDARSSSHLSTPFNSPSKTSGLTDERPTRESSYVEGRNKRSRDKGS